MDRLSASRSYADVLSRDLMQATGAELDFAECSLPAHRRVDAHVNVRAIHREVSERILMEQPDVAPHLVPQWTSTDYEGPTATGAPRRA